MPLEQNGVALYFYAYFSESKVGKTGLTVTVDVWRNRVEVVTGGSATEMGDGIYYYQLASGTNNAEGEYIAIFKTVTATVDSQHVPAIWCVDKAGVENLNATVSSRASQTTLDTLDGFVDTEVAAIKAKTDNLPASPAAVGSAMTLSAGAIVAATFGAGAIDAAAIAADAIGSSELAATAASEIATAVRTELATELARLDAAMTTRASQASVDTVDDLLDTEVAAIIADLATLLARLTAARAGYLDNLNVGGAVASQASVNTIDDFIDTEVAAIKAKTDLIPASPAAVGDVPTAAAVADAVWDEALTGHLTAGSTGARLNSATDPLGPGALTFTYTLTRSDTAAPIDDAVVWVTTDAGGTNIIASGRTNGSGQVVFYLDAGTYYFWRSKSGIDFTNPETEVVA